MPGSVSGDGLPLLHCQPMKQVCGSCSSCDERRKESRGADLDLVGVTLDDQGLRGTSAAIPKGRELKLSPGHFGMENCCGEAATLTVPAPPELWEVINEETFTEAFTSSPKAPRQEYMEPAPPGGELEKATLANPAAPTTLPHEMPWAKVEDLASGLGGHGGGPALGPPTYDKEHGCCLPGRRMNEYEILEQLWTSKWVAWCCCVGFGISRYSAPLGVDFNCLCVNTSCQTTSLREQHGSCCGTFTELCCCRCMCRWPCLTGDPRCVCCSLHLCGLVGSMAKELQKEEHLPIGQKQSRLCAIDESFSRATIPCWRCCWGTGFSFPRTCADTYIKCMQCEYTFSTRIPSMQAGLCLHMVNCWCCYSLGKCPPTGVTYNPICACCGYRCRDYINERIRRWRMRRRLNNHGGGITGDPLQWITREEWRGQVDGQIESWPHPVAVGTRT